MKHLSFLLLALLAQCLSVHAQVDLENGLVAKYSFNGGNANDESGNNNHGTVVGATLAEDRFGNADKAYYFNYSYIKVPHTNPIDLNLMNAVSVSVWVKDADSTAGLHAIVAKWNTASSEQYALYDSENNNMVAIRKVNNGGITDAANRSLNVWHHVVFTYEKGTGIHKIYTDKTVTLNQTKSTSYTQSTIVTSLGIGAQVNDYSGGAASPNRYFNGSIDDVMIYNRVLSQADVDSLFNLQDPTTGLQAPVNQSISVSPNPSEGFIQLSARYDLCLTDLQGRRLLVQPETDHLDLAALPAGMYLLQLRDREGQLVQTTRVVKR